jgi:hypothetical protein
MLHTKSSRQEYGLEEPGAYEHQHHCSRADEPEGRIHPAGLSGARPLPDESGVPVAACKCAWKNHYGQLETELLALSAAPTAVTMLLRPVTAKG